MQRGRTIVVGDIHGCWDELSRLLERTGFGDGDRVIAVGDVVDRGPDTPRVLEFFRSREDAVTIQGNHERKHVRSARGEILPALSQRIARRQLGEGYDDWVAWMDGLPRMVELDEAILVHAFWEPGVRPKKQLEKVLLGTLSGEAHLDARLPAPWYELYDGGKPIVVGHRDYLGTGEPLVREERVYAIDTGCVHGGRLTALILPGFEIVSVPARADHWLALQESYACLVEFTRPDVDLDWRTLRRYAGSAGTLALPASARDRAARCAFLWRESERVAEAIVERIRARSDSILRKLRRSAEPPRPGSRKEAAKFAKRAKREPNPSLLFHARRGTLDAGAVYRRAKNPRKLDELAAELGISCALADAEPPEPQ